MSTALTITVAVLLSVVIGAVVRRRFARRYASAGQVEAVLRVVQGSQVALTGRWRHGLAEGSVGHLRFQPRGPGGLRLRRGEALDIPVASARTDWTRQTPLKTAWSLKPGMRIAVLTTPTATLELAAQQPSPVRLVQWLQPGDQPFLPPTEPHQPEEAPRRRS